jgi:hypothetical protein
MHEAERFQDAAADLFKVGEREVGGVPRLAHELSKLVEVFPQQLRHQKQVLLEVEKVVPFVLKKCKESSAAVRSSFFSTTLRFERVSWTREKLRFGP